MAVTSVIAGSGGGLADDRALGVAARRPAPHAGDPSDRCRTFSGGPRAVPVGLGLSIVQAVARAHDGTATAEASNEGGLTVRVALPSPAVGSASQSVPTIGVKVVQRP